MPTWDVRFDLHLDLRNEDLLTAMTQAEEIANFIGLLPVPPEVLKRVNRLNILRAVRGTTGLEGANLTEEEVDRVLASDTAVLGEARRREEAEARNANDVMQFVAEALQTNPNASLSEPLIREIHERTTRNIDYRHNVPGTYREHAVTAGTYTPPRTGEEVRHLMTGFIEWFNDGPPRGWPAVIQAVAAHFFFISIHPFGDGNGRTARGIESFLLYKSRVNVVGFYSLSNFYYRNRAEYIEMLDYTRFQSRGNLTPFVTFALRGLIQELHAIRDEILDELTFVVFRDYTRDVLLREGKTGSPAGERMLALIEGIGRQPIALADLRRANHPLGQLWRRLSAKTLDRDLKFLQEKLLIVRERESIRLNLGITHMPSESL